MPIFVAAIGGMLLNIVASVVGRVLLSLGIAVFTYTGFSSSLDFLKSQAISSFSGLPAQSLSLLAYMRAGECISIISSAMVVRALIDGIQGDSFRKFVLKA